MARKPSPWWWDEEQGWYVNHQGKRHFLGKHPEDAATPKKSKRTGKWNTPTSIDEEFRRLLDGKFDQPAEDGSEYVATYFQAFLSWCKENRAAKTTERYFDFLDSFERHHHGLSIGQMHAGHVTDWLAEHKDWNSTTKFNAITALQRALNWSTKNKGLGRNPIHGMEKPQAKKRTETITPEEFELLLKKAKPAFRELLIVSYDSGARPFEVKELERRHMQLDRRRAVIPADEAKGKKHTRVFYFPTDRCMEIVQRLCVERPVGPIFLNSRGRKWNDMSVKCAFAKLDSVLGRRVTHYALRHSFITRKLVAGVDSHVVAKLAGHRDTRMIDTVYSHVADNFEFMIEQASKDVLPKANPEKDA